MSLDDAIRGYESATRSTFRGVPEDWSTHHVIYSHIDPNSAAASAVQKDPRYWLQQIRQGRSAGAAWAPLAAPDVVAWWKRHAHRDWSENLGSGATLGAGQFPAKYSFSTNRTPSCTADFVVFNTGLAGSVTQASILAYNELYKRVTPACTPAVPSPYWAYNTGGTVNLSPILSIDGTQVAFVQTSSTNVASLVVLKWKAGGTVSAPTTLSSTSSYAGCTAPCMISLPFNGSANDLTSAPFYDYSGINDTLYVGDSAGKLHQFHPVFNGTTSAEPAEIITGGFPVTVSQATTMQPLASPVYDSGTGQVFVGDGHAQSGTGDGEFHAILASSGALTNSLATICHGVGYADPPLLDPTASRLYISCGNDQGGGTCASGSACIRQFAENFASGDAGSSESLGTTADEHVYPGAFDNFYLNSSSGSSPTGNLYVCGNPGGQPTLYRVPITSNAIGTPVSVATLSTTTNTTLATSLCSPVTEFYNTSTSTDWMFVGTAGTGNQTGCTSTTIAGCVYSFNATSALPAAASTVKTVASAGIAATSGSSGLIVDNIGAATSTIANVYYSTLANQSCATSGGTGGCAVQAAQSGLQ